MHITMIVTEVVPFLVLALGVDNMFIITKAFDRRWEGPLRGLVTPLCGGSDDVPTAMARALEEVGPSITAAAACGESLHDAYPSRVVFTASPML